MSKKRVKIFMTGGTGFLGKEVVRILKNSPLVDLRVLSRTANTGLTGDLSLWNAGLDLKPLAKEKFDVFLHLAGLYDLNAPYHEIIVNNVFGTNTSLKLTQELDIPIFINASSVAAVSNMSGVVSPYESHLINPFPDPYSEGKALTEVQIQNWPNKNLKKINLRLGVLVGNSNNGEIQRVDGPYKAVQGFLKLRNYIENWPGIFLLPGNEQVKLPFVPVDVAAEAIVNILNHSLSESESHDKLQNYYSYHITPKKGVGLRDFYSSVMRHLNFKKSEFKLIKELPANLTAEIANRIFEFPKEQLKYALSLPEFSSVETTKVLGDHWCPEYFDYEQTFWSGYEKFVSHS
ncbi:MAG: SDR family oxidoreductase [Bdellovibrionaceae bacterium]|nr:SDR family oxidoreductase [Pseudobdellovibrionaceae bacterium]